MLIHLIKYTEPIDEDCWYATTLDSSYWSRWQSTVEKAIQKLISISKDDLNKTPINHKYVLDCDIHQLIEKNPSLALFTCIDTDLVQTEADLQHYYPEHFV